MLIYLILGKNPTSEIQTISSDVQNALIESQILVKPDYYQNQITKWASICEISHKKLWTDGYVVIQDLLNNLQLDFLRSYNRSILTEFQNGASIKVQNHNWNDEPVARYFNFEFTNLMSRIIGEPLLHSSLALTIWIHPGPGFQIHTDTNPPFDVTLDIAIDHNGQTPRTLNFIPSSSF